MWKDSSHGVDYRRTLVPDLELIEREGIQVDPIVLEVKGGYRLRRAIAGSGRLVAVAAAVDEVERAEVVADDEDSAVHRDQAIHYSSRVTGAIALLADIGGTNARFGVLRDGRVERRLTLRCASFPGLRQAAEAYLSGLEERPLQAALAVAGPVTGDRVKMTNHVWSFSIEDIRRQLELERLEVINDFSALALALPQLEADDLAVVRPGLPVEHAPIGLLGPGTGLGVGGLVWHQGRPAPLATEGGHRDLAATTEREWAVCRRLQERFGRVSAERALSGPGLVNLNAAICTLEGEPGAPSEPSEVVAAARAGQEHAVEAVELFTGWLAAVASDLALTLGARGGIYLGGGVVPRLGALFDRQQFEERFLAKGRFRPYLEPIPVSLVRRTEIALLGVARLFD